MSKLPQFVKGDKIVWVRIQGGEPCLTLNRILNTIQFAVESLNIIHTNSLNYYKDTRAVIQTNAIRFSNLNTSQIDKIRLHLENSLDRLEAGRVVFEVSFKSPNGGRYLKPQVKYNILDRQIEGYNVLLRKIIMPLWDRGYDNIVIYPVAGLGPSVDGDNLFIIPIDPQSLPDEIPLFHPNTWSLQFRDLVNEFTKDIVPNYSVYESFRKNPRTNEGRKIAIEELEPAAFQASWISGYAGGYDKFNVNVIPVNNILRKLTGDVPTNPQWRRWYNSWTSNVLFGRSTAWRNVLDQIPVSQNPNNLLLMVQQMRNYFYPSHPIGHYPYL